ncbi:transporter [Calidifontibacter sp. DB0510]|uniref:Transporter n=1 Tax=Metallococcus carri TaxID=1656884 RepID=A0A967B3H2_9MICO|nr:AmiS/UreI family transporter [Metallococcus carri]NHN57294.1 transporter [Metallococcus carri]NOP38101.1 transporter [Calidifontibacter sp. DB2511S]
MSAVGLFYVGAVLVLNGVMLLGCVTPRGAAPLNLFVGTLQVVTPTYLVMTSGGAPDAILAAAGLYLFGFTYLWVGINALAGLPDEGLGWFSLFVAVAALAYAVVNLRAGAPVFAVIWVLWALLWLLFFLVLALGFAGLVRFTGALAVLEGVVTAAVPAWLILNGYWSETATAALVAGVVALVGLVGLWLSTKASMRRAEPAATPARACTR